MIEDEHLVGVGVHKPDCLWQMPLENQDVVGQPARPQLADAAKEYSDDPGSKDKGGLYEDTAFGKFVPEFDKAVRAQELGKVGEPVKSMHGYHLIQVEKLTPATPQTFEAAKEAAKQQATAERQESVMTNYMNEAKQETDFKEGAAATKAPATPKSTKGAK